MPKEAAYMPLNGILKLSRYGTSHARPFPIISCMAIAKDLIPRPGDRHKLSSAALLATPILISSI